MALTRKDIGTILDRKFPDLFFVGFEVFQDGPGAPIELSMWDEKIMGQPKPTIEQVIAWGEEMGEDAVRTLPLTIEEILLEMLTGPTPKMRDRIERQLKAILKSRDMVNKKS